MKLINSIKWTRFALLFAGLTALATTSGCFQTTVGGQTLPSAFYQGDDVQFFPAGDEFLLPNTVQALEEYKLSRNAIDGGGRN